MVPFEERIPGTDSKFQMAPIQGGEFLVGSPDGESGRLVSEGPQVRIRREPFWMGRHEVTWQEFQSFMSI